MLVLVTGARGAIGRVLSTGLATHGHVIRGLDLQSDGDSTGYAGGYSVGDCLDPRVVDDAVVGVDAVVHLAGNPDEASLPDSLTSHVLTTARILDAMVRHDVRRIVYASSNHAVGYTPRAGLLDEVLTVDVRPRPDTFYGVAKVAAEALLSLYADRHGLDVYALRIGSFLDRPTSRRALSTWLSPDDCVRMADACLTTPEGGYHVIYGVSANSAGWWDLGPGRPLGYEPVDDAADFAAQIADRPTDAVETAVVGGPLALGESDLVPFDAERLDHGTAT